MTEPAKRIARTILKNALVGLSAVAAGIPLLVGFGMLLITAMFCDDGPISDCLHMGLAFLGVCVFFAIWPIPAVLALATDTSRLRGYLKVYPFILLVLCCILYVLMRSFHMELFATKALAGYALLTVCAFLFLLSDRHRATEQRTLEPR